jgi:hypothetical protein
MKIDVNLLETDSQIRQEILKALSVQVNQAMSRSIVGIKSKFIDLLQIALKKEPEYTSLMSGQLRYEFGIPNTGVVDKIIDIITNNGIAVTFNRVVVNARGLKGSLYLTALSKQDIDGVIQTDLASVLDSKGYYLPWLEWLLLKGNSPLVKRFEVRLGSNNRSRTGNAIMVDSTTNWSVPSVFAGTQTNNWFTRAIDNINESDMQKIIQSEIEKNI